MTQSRRVYVGLLGLAAGALAVDALFLRAEPAPASASEQIAQSPPDAEPAVDAPSLAQVIESLGPQEPAREDLFRIPSAWRPMETAPKQIDEGEPMPMLRLTNTLADVAQINGRAVRIGDFIDADRTVRLVRIESVGMRIDAVGRDPSAIVEFSGALYRLRPGESPQPLADVADSTGEG